MICLQQRIEYLSFCNSRNQAIVQGETLAILVKLVRGLLAAEFFCFIEIAITEFRSQLNVLFVHFLELFRQIKIVIDDLMIFFRKQLGNVLGLLDDKLRRLLKYHLSHVLDQRTVCQMSLL